MKAKNVVKSANLDIPRDPSRTKESDAVRKALPGPLVDISPFEPGLTIFAIFDPDLVPDVRAAIEKLALCHSKKIGVPFATIRLMVSQHSGGKRAVEQAKMLAAASPHVKGQAEQEFRVRGQRPGFRWTSPEGEYALLETVEEKHDCVTFEQNISVPVTPATVNGLSRIRNAATNAGTHVIAFVGYRNSGDFSSLVEVCDEYAVVDECEHDPDAFLAFSVDFPALSNLNRLGIGKTMCTVHRVGGLFRRVYTPYVSESLETRVMWIMRGHGKTYEEIGQELGKNASSVWRRLQGLPEPRKLEMEKGWLERYLEYMELTGKKGQEPSDDDQDNELDDDDSDNGDDSDDSDNTLENDGSDNGDES